MDKSVTAPFDWTEFHKSLDQALAIMIMDTNALPTKTTLIEFLEYSNAQANKPSKGRRG